MGLDRLLASRLIGKQPRHPLRCEDRGESQAQGCAGPFGGENLAVEQGRHDPPSMSVAGPEQRADVAARQLTTVQHSFENGPGLWR